MDISWYRATKLEIQESVKDLLQSEFGIQGSYAEILSRETVWPHFNQLIDSIWVLIESPYVDKVYRDSYYHYFASKSVPYHKDCIRISIFREEIPMEHFSDAAEFETISSKYLGFMVLRPTTPHVVGRNCISPNALTNNDFLSCLVNVPATAKTMKLQVKGFPHSSQDTETITCAETTLWALMEYFSYRYAEYKPVLPSNIISALRNVSAERQVPSKGLNIQQITYALKDFGFGPRIYSKAEFQTAFFPLLSIYIESGIPLVMAVQNSHVGGNIAHAMLCIGRERISDSMIDNLREYNETDSAIARTITDKRLHLFDISELENQFVFIDDNRPAFQKAPLSSPTSNYPNPNWHSCQITFFVAPLYPKIYLEAFEAKKYFKQFLFAVLKQIIPDDSELFLRFFLTSSRSYKHSASHNRSMDEDMKSILLETVMPKFIWVGEISEKSLLKQKKAKGVVILDATEANILDNKPLIMAALEDLIVTFDSSSGSLSAISMPFSAFEIFTNYQEGF